MKLETFFESFELLTDAPNAVTKLREVVLQLAVAGKLGTQNLNEEPASTLLEKINAERVKVRKREKTPLKKSIERHQGLPNLPNSWVWCKVEEIATVCLGGTPSRKEPSYWEGNIPWVSSGEVANSRIKFTSELITQQGLENSNAKIYPKNTVLIAMIGQGKTRGQSAILDIEACTNQNVAGLVFDGKNIEPDYVWKWALSEYERTRSGGRGGAQPALNGQKIRDLLIPLPPLAEQKRIVEKCDRLLILCDEIEKRQQQRQESLLKMNEGAIAQLLTAQNSDDFHHHWQRICNNFDLLYSIPETIPKLRQAILQLAVQGKLLPQHPNDEPSSVSLSKIEMKKSRNKQPIDLSKVTYEIPKTWQWVRLGEVAEHCLGKMLDKQKNKGNPLSYLRNLNVRWLDFDLDDILEMPFEDHELERFEVKSGDVLICEGGEPGRAAVWKGQISNMKFQKALHRVQPSEALYNHFLVYCLLLDSMSGRLEQYFTGATFKHFTGQELARYLLPLPPLAEQKRIVVKVDSLLSLCDALEAKLKAARDSSATLMEVAARQILVA